MPRVMDLRFFSLFINRDVSLKMTEYAKSGNMTPFCGSNSTEITHINVAFIEVKSLPTGMRPVRDSLGMCVQLN